MSLAHLRAYNVTVRLGARLVLDAVTVTISAGSRRAIVGENGRGKTTLLHVLAGLTTPDSGSVQRCGTIGLAAQALRVRPGDTVGTLTAAALRESRQALAALDEAAIALSLDAPGAAQELPDRPADATPDRLLGGGTAMGMLDAEALRTPVRLLSPGQQRRLDLALQLAARPDLLIFDEPTDHLSSTSVDELTEALLATPAAVVVATRDRRLPAEVSTWPRLHLEVP